MALVRPAPSGTPAAVSRTREFTIARRVRLAWLRLRRVPRRMHRRLTLFSGWTWIAAGSLVGFEVLDILFGTFILAPELFPLVILCLALAWYFRRALRRQWRRLRARIRLSRLRR